MRFAPQAEKEVAVETGELAAAMHADMAAQAEGDLQGSLVAMEPKRTLSYKVFVFNEIRWLSQAAELPFKN